MNIVYFFVLNNLLFFHWFYNYIRFCFKVFSAEYWGCTWIWDLFYAYKIFWSIFVRIIWKYYLFQNMLNLKFFLYFHLLWKYFNIWVLWTYCCWYFYWRRHKNLRLLYCSNRCGLLYIIWGSILILFFLFLICDVILVH